LVQGSTEGNSACAARVGVVEAWRLIVGLKRALACLALGRQALPTLDRSRYASAAGDEALRSYRRRHRRGRQGASCEMDEVEWMNS